MGKFRHTSHACTRTHTHTHTHTHTPLSPQVILWLPHSTLWSHLLPLSFLSHNKSSSIETTVSLEQELLDSPRTAGAKASTSRPASWFLELSVRTGPFLSLLSRFLLPITCSHSCTGIKGPGLLYPSHTCYPGALTKPSRPLSLSPGLLEGWSGGLTAHSWSSGPQHQLPLGLEILGPWRCSFYNWPQIRKKWNMLLRWE